MTPEKLSQPQEKHEQGLSEEYEKSELKEHFESILNYAISNARDILKNPKKLISFEKKIINDKKLDEFFTQNVKRGRFPSLKNGLHDWFIQSKMIDSVRNDTPFMKEIINMYRKSSNSILADVCRVCILKTDIKDDEFFKKVVKEANHVDIRCAGIKRIKDQNYLFEYVEKVDDDADVYGESYIASHGLTDQNLTKIVQRRFKGSTSRKLALQELKKRKLDKLKNNNK